MSLLGNGTLAAPEAPYYGGGGGGGGSATSTVTSTLAVENVTTLPGVNQIIFDAPVVNMANSLVYVSSLSTANPGDVIDMGAGLSWAAGGGALVGVSSINGAPPLAAPISTVTGSVTAGSAPVALNATPVPTTAGKCYMASITIDGANLAIVPAAAVPTPGDHCSIVADQNIIGTIDLVSLSSMKGKGQPLGFSFSAPVVASGTSLSFSAYCSANATASTFLVSSSPAWVVPLN